jgi:hypothetical protein
VDTVGQYNLNTTTNPALLGLGTASQPLDIAYGKTAGDTLFWPGFSSSYNALQVKLDRHMANFNITTAFNYGKGMDYQSSDDGGYDFYVGFQRNYARDDWDRTLSFVQSYVYQTPFGVGQRWLNHGPAAVILGNWQIAGVLSLMTGTPIGTVGASGSALNTQRGQSLVRHIQLYSAHGRGYLRQHWPEPLHRPRPVLTESLPD